MAFPGGKVASSDADVNVCSPPTPSTTDDVPRPRLVAAARELFEETGVLVARRADGSFLPFGPELERLRRALIEGHLLFSDLLARLGLTLHRADWTPVGSVTTPA